MNPSASGLDGFIVAAETGLSDVDGELGRLVIRGHFVEDLVEHAAFEDVCGLLWTGTWPSAAERDGLGAALAAARQDAFALLPSLGNALDAADGMEAVRTAASHVSEGANIAQGEVRLTGALPVFAAAWARGRAGQPPVAPRPSLSHAADYLQMLSEPCPNPHAYGHSMRTCAAWPITA